MKEEKIQVQQTLESATANLLKVRIDKSNIILNRNVFLKKKKMLIRILPLPSTIGTRCNKKSNLAVPLFSDVFKGL